MTHQKLDEKDFSAEYQNELKERLRGYEHKIQDQARELAELKAKNLQLEADIDQIKDPSYCPICESCGVEGCCSLQRCKFAPTEDEIINSLNEQNAGLREDLKNQKEELLEARQVIGFYASKESWKGIFTGNWEKQKEIEAGIYPGLRAREHQKKFGDGK